MSYEFRLSDGSVEAAVRRIAVHQIERALGQIEDPGLDPASRIHEARKRCKKLRGLIRLVRPVFDGYGPENKAFRDAARSLAPLRDSDVLVETYDALVRFYADQIDRQALSSVRRRLTLRKKELHAQLDTDRLLSDFALALGEARSRARRWKVSDRGFDACAGGLRKTYKRAVKAMERAVDSGSAEDVHEWRKRVKYHGYHTRLLTPVWTDGLEAHRALVDRINGLLGEHHDLAVLHDTILEDPHAYGREGDVEVFLALIVRRQTGLTPEAFDLGRRLLAESPGALVARWEAYWNAWRDETRGGPAEAA